LGGTGILPVHNTNNHLNGQHRHPACAIIINVTHSNKPQFTLNCGNFPIIIRTFASRGTPASRKNVNHEDMRLSPSARITSFFR
jgi:hypothetical protein